MEQHLYKGRGAPDFVPPELNAHYVDLNTKEVYVAGGTSIVGDWGTPLITKTAMHQALTDFANAMSSNNAPVVEVKVQNIAGRGRYATLDPELHAGRFVIITADTNDAFKIEIVPSNVLQLGQTIGLYNSTDVATVIDTYNCQVAYALNNSAQAFNPGAVADIRLIKVNAELPYYLVSGQLEGIQGEGGDAWEDVVTVNLTDGETGPEVVVDMQTMQGKYIYVTNTDNLTGTGTLFVLNADTAGKAGGRFGLWNATNLDLNYDSANCTPMSLPTTLENKLAAGEQVLGRVVQIGEGVLPIVLMVSTEAGQGTGTAYWEEITTYAVPDPGAGTQWAVAEIDMLTMVDNWVMLTNPNNLTADEYPQGIYLDFINGEQARVGSRVTVFNGTDLTFLIDNDVYDFVMVPPNATAALVPGGQVNARLVEIQSGRGKFMITGPSKPDASGGVMQHITYTLQGTDLNFNLDDGVGNFVELLYQNDATNPYFLNIRWNGGEVLGKQLYLWNNTARVANLNEGLLFSEFALGAGSYDIQPHALLVGTVVDVGEAPRVVWSNIGAMPSGGGGGLMDFTRIIELPVQNDDPNDPWFYVNVYPDDSKAAVVFVTDQQQAAEGVINVELSWPNDYSTGEGFYLRNHTGVPMRIRNSDMYIDYAPSVDDPIIPSGGLVNMRYLASGDSETLGNEWMASGDIVNNTSGTDKYNLWQSDGSGVYTLNTGNMQWAFNEMIPYPSLPGTVLEQKINFYDSGAFPTLEEFRIWNNGDLPLNIDVGQYSTIGWALKVGASQHACIAPRGVATMKCLVGDQLNKRWVVFGNLVAVAN